MDKITGGQIESLAEEFDLDVALVKTFLIVESSGSGFDPATGKIKIQFEPAYFEHYTRTKILNKVDVQSKEWEAFNAAYKIDPESALLSTSWGLGQIMGAEFKKAGYETVDRMVAEFKLSEFYQVKGTLNFIKNKPGLYDALKLNDWQKVAYLYNGSHYDRADPPYDQRLKTTYSKLKIA